MFWDKVAGVYDIFTNIINRKTHQTLCAVIADLIRPTDEVLECACGTGMLSGVITDREPAEEWLQFFTEQGIRCYYPN